MSRITSYFSALADFDPNAQIYFDAAGITDTVEKNSVNTKVLSLKADSLYNGVIYPISPTSLEAASYNLVDPTKFQLTYINSPSFGPTGVKWDGLTQYARTGIVPSVDLTDNDVHLSYYSRDNAINGIEFGAVGGGGTLQLVLKFGDGKFYLGVYGGAEISSVNADSKGLGVGTKRGLGDNEIYMNDLSLASSAANAGVPPNIELYLGAKNTGPGATNVTGKECASASAGLGLTDAKEAIFNNIIKTYQETVIVGGRAVV